MRVFTYVIQFDAGAAPNYCEPATTLAICKPRIRRSAQVGDAVLAFQGSFLGPEPHAVCWAGLITEKLIFEDYWNDARFASKKPDACSVPDNIYLPMRGGLAQVRNNVHGPEETQKDIGGQFVLVCGESWRFGSAAPVMPADLGLRMVGGRRAHRAHEIEDAQWRRLKAWLNRCAQELGGPISASEAQRGCGSDKAKTCAHSTKKAAVRRRDARKC